MKLCTSCNIKKPIDNFYFKVKSKNLRQPLCKPCFKQSRKAYYIKNKNKVLQKNYERRKHLANEVDKLKTKHCKDCGKIYEVYCMDFDHINSDKIMAISKMVHETFSLENIKKEIAKTELVCILCHKTRTHLRQKNMTWPKESANREKIKQRNKNIVNLAKDRPCNICGIKYNLWQMEFDHINPSEKKAAIASLKSQRYSELVLNNEISKCQVLCALCHRRKTFKTFNYRGAH